MAMNFQRIQYSHSRTSVLSMPLTSQRLVVCLIQHLIQLHKPVDSNMYTN